MNNAFDLDRQIAGYLESRLTTRPPDGLLENALAVVTTTAQRPRWRTSDWWAVTPRVRLPRTAFAIVLLTALLLVVALAAGLLVGSPHRPAPPFGPARPGLIAFDLGGDIFVANPDGSARRPVTSGPSVDTRPTWSPDGTRLAYERSEPGQTSAIVVIDEDGRNPVVVAQGLPETGDLAWAPDSRRIAFSAGSTSGLDGHLFVADIDRPGAVRLGPPDLAGIEPSWSPEGREIAFKRLGPCCFPPSDTLWLIDSDGSNPRQLSSAGGRDWALWNTAWSPDGARLAFLAIGAGGNFDVYVIGADGTRLAKITDTPDDESWPSWSPDGTQIAFARMRGDVGYQGTLIVARADGSSRREFPGTPINMGAPVWSPDGTRLAVFAEDPSGAIDQNLGLAIFDPLRPGPPAIVPAVSFTSASWQRLAP